MPSAAFDKDDHRQLIDRGISIEDAERQIGFFLDPPRPTQLVRACTVGDGIHRVPGEDFDELEALHAEAAARYAFGVA